MSRFVAAVMLTLAIGFAPASAVSQESKGQPKAVAVKAGKDQKVCRYKFPDGEKRTWVCDKAVPCCAWDAIKYVKCGSTVTGCL